MIEPINMYEKYYKNPKREPVLVDYVRTPIGRRRGTIGRHRGDDLVVHCYQTIIKRNEFDPLRYLSINSLIDLLCIHNSLSHRFVDQHHVL